MIDPKKFVAQLTVPSVKMDEGFLDTQNIISLESVEDDKAENYMDNKSLISFVAEVSGQLRKDTLNSSLLAQRVAEHYFPENSEILNWYKKYIEVMTGIGWTIEQKDFVDYSADSNIFEMESAVVSIITALVGQNYALAISSSLDALKGLADDDGIIQAFEKNTHGVQKGNFQIGLATQTNGVVSLHIGAFMLNTKEEIKKILFFKSKKDKTTLSYFTTKCTLNEEVYALVRNDILEKLGVSTKKFIAKLPDLS